MINADQLFDILTKLPEPDATVRFWRSLSVDQKRELFPFFLSYFGEDAYALFVKDPEEFISVVMGEAIWSKQRQIVEALSQPNASVAVPACHSPGKTHTATRIGAWWGSCFPNGLAKCVTTASNWTQVERLFWAQLRQAHDKYRLPGTMLTTAWKRGKTNDAQMWGFSVANNDEVGAHGVHAPYVLIIVDEASGIPHSVGQSLEGLRSSGDVRMLVLGNPPMDQQGTWFELFCASPYTTTIPIPAFDTPNFTGETTGLCACPNPVPHPISTHLVNPLWVERLVADYGDESPIVQAKVHARFPRNSRLTLISPDDWDQATHQADPNLVRSEINVGVDVAAGGGDELVICAVWPDGQATIELTESAAALSDPTVAASVIINKIAEIQQRGLAEYDYTYLPVILKYDATGVGWGLGVPLQDAEFQGIFYGDVIPIQAGASASDKNKFLNKRAEMWWQLRESVKQKLICVPNDEKSRLQATRVEFKFRSGKILIESKDDMRKRLGGAIGSSPDRADALCLAIDTTQQAVWFDDDPINPFERY